jgi:two-component system response regulator MprA
VLVVEDDPWIQWMIADDLTDRGHRVIVADDGIEALQQVARARSDVVVLDLMLPSLDGWQFAERCSSVTDGRQMPIVAVTASREPMLPGSREFRRCLRKPFDMEELAQIVAELAKREPIWAAPA